MTLTASRLHHERRLVIVGYGDETNAATRLRALQFLPEFTERGFRVTFVSVPHSQLYSLRRIVHVVRAVRRADTVLVQRVLAAWLIVALRLGSARVAFDFDDALHYIRQSQYASAVSPHGLRAWAVVLARQLIRGGRLYGSRKRLLESMLRISDVVVAGNEYLARYARSHAANVHIAPTAVPVLEIPVKEHAPTRPVRIGWIGVSSNLLHLQSLAGAFRRLHEQFGDGVELAVVSSRQPEPLPIPTRFLPWGLQSESSDVMTFDIGIMPLQDDLFSRGKCSFKAIFCMAHGIPVVVSPVGMNNEVVDHRVNGFFASTEAEWVDALTCLVADVDLRKRLGAAARETVASRFDARVVGPAVAECIAECSPPKERSL